MILFTSDLDNTLIYSYKHEIGPDKKNVEIYQGREISFITNKTYSLLKELNSKITFVPVTTRSVEQYQRINLDIGPIKYALTCNGGILLINGIKDENWYKESINLISSSLKELQKGKELLEKEPLRTFEVRFVENLFVWTKCDSSDDVVQNLKKQLDNEKVQVFNNGVKVYIIPKNLDKGTGINRLKNLLSAEKIIAAGDSDFDLAMIPKADKMLVPEFFFAPKDEKIIRQENDKKIFSEFIMEKVLEILKN